jgi:8-oxo-dGTP pyrophosphatase MutT (NUDIX family)
VWGLAKGAVEQGERPEDAAVREVKEETGIKARIRKPLGDISYWFVWDGERIRKTVRFFLMDHVGGDVRRHDREMEEVRWFPLDEAIELAGYGSEKEVLQKARDALAEAS